VEPGLAPAAVVEGHAQERVGEVVVEAERQHDDVGLGAPPLAEQDEQGLARIVALDGQVAGLDAVVASVEEIGEGLRVGDAQTESDGVAEDDDPGAARGLRERQLAPTVAALVEGHRLALDHGRGPLPSGPAERIGEDVQPAALHEVVGVDPASHGLHPDDREHDEG
jgi:hypothetical protein